MKINVRITRTNGLISIDTVATPRASAASARRAQRSGQPAHLDLDERLWVPTRTCHDARHLNSSTFEVLTEATHLLHYVVQTATAAGQAPCTNHYSLRTTEDASPAPREGDQSPGSTSRDRNPSVAGISGYPQAQKEMGDGASLLSRISDVHLIVRQAVTIPATIAGFVGGVSYFGTLEMDPSKPIFVRSPPSYVQLHPTNHAFSEHRSYVCVRCSHLRLCRYVSSRLFEMRHSLIRSRPGLSRGPSRRVKHLAHDAPPPHEAYRKTRQAVPRAHRQEPGGPYCSERYQPRSRLLWCVPVQFK